MGRIGPDAKAQGENVCLGQASVLLWEPWREASGNLLLLTRKGFATRIIVV